MPNFRPPEREHFARVCHGEYLASVHDSLPQRGFTAGLILLAALGMGVPAGGQQDSATPSGLSRADAIQEALAHHPGLLASREQVEQARAQVVEATALADPSLSATTLGQSKALAWARVTKSISRSG